MAHLQAIHHFVFGDLYPWAGQLRTVPFSKDGSLFARPDFIESEARKLFATLGKERYLKGLPQPLFVDRIAHYLTELNAIHPFREGNGRTQRAFIEQLAREAGHHLDLSRIPATELNQVSRAAHVYGSDRLSSAIRQALETDLGRGR